MLPIFALFLSAAQEPTPYESPDLPEATTGTGTFNATRQDVTEFCKKIVLANMNENKTDDEIIAANPAIAPNFIRHCRTFWNQ